MGLIATEDLRELCDEAIAIGLAEPPDRLFFGFAPEVVAQVRRTETNRAIALPLEATHLNNLMEPTAEGYLLALWLRNCATEAKLNPSKAAFFTEWMNKVNRRPPPSRSSEESTALAVESLDRPATRSVPAIATGIQRLALYMSGQDSSARDLMISKRVHDILHRTQIELLPILSLGQNIQRPVGKMVKPLVQKSILSLTSNAAEMRGEVVALAAEHDLIALVDQSASQVEACADAARSALAQNNRKDFGAALFELRQVIKSEMPRFAIRMEIQRGMLQLDRLIADLSDILVQTNDEALTSPLTGAIQSLTTILQNLSRLGPHHSEWQSLDLRLWAIEDAFASLTDDPNDFAAENFKLQWQGIQTLLERLAGIPKADWFANVADARDAFLRDCPLPLTKTPDLEDADNFNSFINATRVEFRWVDQTMKETCVSLVGITTQLARLVG